MKLLEKGELRVVLISTVVAIVICLAINHGRDEVRKPVQIIETSKSVAHNATDVAKNAISVDKSEGSSFPNLTPQKQITNLQPTKTVDEWQQIVSAISPGFKVDKILPIEGTEATNLVDDRKDVANLNSAILTIANDGSWWQDSTGFHLTVKNGSPISDTKSEIKRTIAKQVLEAFPKEGVILFPSTAPAGIKPVDVYLFSSLDCVYCRHVEADMAKYQASGVNMHILPFPRTGPGSPAWRLAQKIWCSPNAKRPELLNEGFSTTTGDDVPVVDDKDLPDPNAVCNAWVKKGFDDAVWLSVPGTPGIFASNGKLIGGYIPPENLKEVAEAALSDH